MKRLVQTLLFGSILFLTSFRPPYVKEQIIKDFQCVFPKADSVNWRDAKNGCDVLFISEGIHYHIWYSSNGDILKVYRFAPFNFLSPYLKLSLQKKFPLLQLYGIEETDQDQEINFRIILQSSTHWYHIHGDAYGNFQLEEKYKKAS